MQIDKREKMIPRGQNSLIFCNSDWGPMFGEGDLFLSDNCHSNRNSGSFFPCIYNSK